MSFISLPFATCRVSAPEVTKWIRTAGAYVQVPLELLQYMPNCIHWTRVQLQVGGLVTITVNLFDQFRNSITAAPFGAHILITGMARTGRIFTAAGQLVPAASGMLKTRILYSNNNQRKPVAVM